MSDSEAPRSDKQCLAVPDSDGNGAPPNGNGNGDGAPSSSKLAHRRCSARLLSLNVREAIRVLRQKEHKARVSALVQRNADFYRKQRCCECAAMMSVLAIFTSFALYVIFAYGFHIGKRLPFTLVQSNYTSKIKKMEGDTGELWCQTDQYWEWCRWVHYDKYCDFEWESYSDGVVTTSCDFPPGKVELLGDYDQFQCGIRIHDLDTKDRGLWLCEVEKYYSGFSRRYGELRTAPFTVVVVEPAQSSPTSDLLGEDPFYPRVDGNQSQGMDDNLIWYASFMNLSHPTPTGNNPNRSGDGEFHDDGRNQSGNTTLSSLIIENREEYQRKFFLLKVFILGGISIVLGTLAVIFWTYFMYLWRTWDTKREPTANDYDEDMDYFDELEDINVNNTLMNSRRKSVSFTVVQIQDDQLSFDLSRRSVLLGNNGSRSGSITATGELKPPPQGSPTPSAPVLQDRRESYDFALAIKSNRRLSLAPEDALKWPKDCT